MLKHPVKSLAPLPYMGMHSANLWDFTRNFHDLLKSCKFTGCMPISGGGGGS